MAVQMRRGTPRRRGKVRAKASHTNPRGSAYTFKPVNYQNGTTTPYVDVQLDAMPPGWRMSKHNRIYEETRKNRSDLRGLI